MKKNQEKDEAELERLKRLRLRGELPEEDEDEDEDWDPEAIQTCCYANDGSGRFIITSRGQFAGWYYICEWDKERPVKAVEIRKGLICNFFNYSPSGEFITASCVNGSTYIWSQENENMFLEVKMHDGH